MNKAKFKPGDIIYNTRLLTHIEEHDMLVKAGAIGIVKEDEWCPYIEWEPEGVISEGLQPWCQNQRYLVKIGEL